MTERVGEHGTAVQLEPFGPSPGWWRRWPVQAGLVGYLILLGWLTFAAAGAGTLRWDVPVQRVIRRLDGPGWDAVASVGNWLGGTLVGLVVLAAVALPLLVRRRLPEAALLGGVALIRSLNWVIKWVVNSPRPFTTDHQTNDVASGLGYPSGHAMGTMLIGGALMIVVFRSTRSPVVRAGVGIVATVAILATGFARVVTRAHWPSDVVGGWLWGIALLGVVVLLVGAADRRRVSAISRRLTVTDSPASSSREVNQRAARRSR